jgi:hypothetical protein
LVPSNYLSVGEESRRVRHARAKTESFITIIPNADEQDARSATPPRSRPSGPHRSTAEHTVDSRQKSGAPRHPGRRPPPRPLDPRLNRTHPNGSRNNDQVDQASTPCEADSEPQKSIVQDDLLHFVI